MKRSVNVLLSLVLSLMLIYLGSGIVLQKCSCNGSMSVVTEKPCCESRVADSPRRSCMTFTVMKLSPVSAATHFERQAPPAFALPDFFGTALARLHWQAPVKIVTRAPGEAFHAPPRIYLALIRVLVI